MAIINPESKNKVNRVELKKNALAVAVSAALMAQTAFAADDVPELETVVVTGEKIERKLNETLSSVVATTAKDIQEHADRTVSDTLARTPGVFKPGGTDNNLSLRGVAIEGTTDVRSVNNAITVIVDDAPVSRNSVRFAEQSTWDIEQIEVFRGPQSTNQGRNALAGAIVVRSKNPSFKPELAARVNAGNYGERGAAIVANGVIAPGAAAVRLSVDQQESDGFIRNDTLNKDADAQRNLIARGKLLLTPTEDLDVLLTLAHQKHREGQRWVKKENGAPQYWHLESGVDGHEKVEQDTVTGKFDYRLNDRWTLTGIASHVKEDYDSKQDFGSNASSGDDFLIRTKTKVDSQELRLGYAGATLKGHVGVYHAQTSLNENANLPLFTLTRTRDVSIDTQAVFGEAEWSFVPRWQLIGGLRYDHESNSAKEAGNAGDAHDEVKRMFNALLPKAGIAHQLADNQRVGFTVQRGYRAGGSKFNLTEDRSVAFDPEYTTNYELAYRSNWLDQRLQFNANAYYTQWRDQQVSVLSIPGDDNSEQVVNAAKSRLKGIELSSELQATADMKLYGSYAYNRTKFVSFTSTSGDLSGKPFERSPEHKLAFGASYRLGHGWRVGGDVVYQSDSNTYNGSTTRKNDAFTVVNANLEKQLGKWGSVSTYVKNAFNKKYEVNNQNDNEGDVGAPRTFGVSLTVKM